MEGKDINRFEVLRGVFAMIDGMYGFRDSDYGRGMLHGIVSTIRALDLEKDFQEFLNQKKEENHDNSVLSDRVE